MKLIEMHNNITVYTFCWNELPLLPYVVEYWKTYAKKVVVYDNNSTDGSPEYLSQFDWVEIRKFNMKGFDKSTISYWKNKCSREAEHGWTMICDIDEVIRVEDFLKVMDACDAVNLQMYNVLLGKTPVPMAGVCAHRYPKVACARWQAGDKTMLFNADKCKSYGDDFSGARIAKCPGLHLKLFGLDRATDHQIKLHEKDKQAKLEFGYDTPSVATAYAMASSAQYGWMGKLSVHDTIQQRDKANKPKKHTDVEWHDTEIHGSLNGGRCAVVIPVYKYYPEAYEIASIQQGAEVFKDRDIVLWMPESFDDTLYQYMFGRKFPTLRCTDAYFTGQEPYSWMCERPEFYKCFQNYDYLLIYQPDGWAFEDRLDEFMNKGFDYIGSPWQKGHTRWITEDKVGNGGVSLRKVQTFIDVCSALDLDEYPGWQVKYEDLLFSFSLSDKVKAADLETASLFSFDAAPEYWFEKNGGNLPMCAHAWRKWSWASFWQKHIAWRQQ